MFFTQDDYKKIQQWLIKNSVKDTEFNEANLPFNGEETITIVQGNQNKKVFLKDLIAQVFNLGISDFVNITDKYNAPNISLEEAIRLIPSRARKEGQVITFLDKEDHWHIYQFKGVLNQWNVLDTWEDLFDWEKLIIDSILPDEEDLTKSLPDTNGNSYLSLKDRAYNPEDFSGLGRVILRKNIVDIEDPIYGKVKKNVLYQDMINKENTIYEIRYDFDLNGGEITIPEGCVLDFQGGSFSNGIVIGNRTLLSGTVNCKTSIDGTFVNEYLNIIWFGAKGNDNFDCTSIIKNTFDVAVNSKCDLYIPEGIFAIKQGKVGIGPRYTEDLNVRLNEDNYFDCNNIKIYGTGNKSIIKSYYVADVINIFLTKNLTIDGLCVEGSIPQLQSEEYGQNLISIIDAINISIYNCTVRNAYYKWRPESLYVDGGKGITVQGSYFKNINVENCYAENCAYGFDFTADAIFLGVAGSSVRFNNVVAKKCYRGVVCTTHRYNNTGYTEDISDNSLIEIYAKTINCFQSLKTTVLCGANIIIDNISLESHDELLKNGYGESWFANTDSDVLGMGDDFISSYVAFLYTLENCNIRINSYSKELNFGGIIYGSWSLLDTVYYWNNTKLEFNLNPDVSIVPKLGSYTITNESKIKVFTKRIPYFKKSLFIINGCDLTDSSFFGDYTNRVENNIFVLDNYLYIDNIKVKNDLIIKGIITDSMTIGEAPNPSILKKDGVIQINRYAGSEKSKYPTIFFGNDDGTQKSGINFEGDIYMTKTLWENGEGDHSMIAGGCGIHIRDIKSPYDIKGYLMGQVLPTKGSTELRNSLEIPNKTHFSGAFYFDTTLNKPIWWNGSKWIDATGVEV